VAMVVVVGVETAAAPVTRADSAVAVSAFTATRGLSGNTDALAVAGLDSPAALTAVTAYRYTPLETPVSVNEVTLSLTDAICAKSAGNEGLSAFDRYTR